MSETTTDSPEKVNKEDDDDESEQEEESQNVIAEEEQPEDDEDQQEDEEEEEEEEEKPIITLPPKRKQLQVKQTTIVQQQLKHEPTKHTCGLCNVIIYRDSDFMHMSCGHTYHARCAYVKISRFYGYCPLCHPEKAFGTLIADPEAEQVHPVDWGDDIRIDDMIQKRKIVIRAISRCRNDIKEVKARDISAHFENKEDSDVYADEEDEENRIWHFIRDLFTKALHADMTTKAYIDIERDPLLMIQERTASHVMHDKYHVDANVLHKKKISIDTLLRNGYKMEDFVLFQITWRDLRNMGLSPTSLREYKNKSLPIRLMVAIWNISVHDIFVDICNRDFTTFASVGFTYDELKALQAADVKLLIDIGLNRDNMSLLLFDMDSWSKMGLTVAIMKEQPLKLSEKFISSNLNWFQYQSDKERFKEIFGEPVSALNTRTIRTKTKK